jgi:PAS domain S-box-containing protein
MESDKDRSLETAAAELRLQAEERLSVKTAELHPPRTKEATKRLVHELEVHQIELEMQNAELRRIQEELEISRNTYAELYDFAPVGYFTFDARGLIRVVNLAGAQLLGLDRRMLTDKPFINFIADADGRENFSSHLERVLQRRELQSCAIRLTGKDGTVIYGQLQSVTLDTNGSKAGYILCLIVDVTVAKQLAEELQQAHDNLEVTVQERTRELTSANLQLTEEIEERMRAGEELQKKNAEIEQFIYTVSHDLRSPLVTVKTFLGFLENDMAGNDQERASQDMQFMHNAADKMKMLLDELLELSRIGRVETTPVGISLVEVMAEAVGTLAGVIAERTADIRLPDTDLMLFGDRPRLCQIWQNLIENAIKYSRDDSISRIELGIRQMSGETVFFVKDNGIGIDSQYHTKIFGIFEKLDPKSPGAGLGLSMIQRIVEKYGGKVWVESEVSDKGSCFYFTLPQAVVQS